MAEKDKLQNTKPQGVPQEELQTLGEISDAVEVSIPETAKKKLRVSEEGHEYKT